MSQYSEIMDELTALREQNDWLVSAVKHLLGAEVGWQPEEPLDELTDDLDLDGDVLVPVHAAHAPKRKPCPHNRQGIDDNGNLVCQKCGHVFGDSGVVQNRVGENGSIIPDSRPPRWATQQSPGASSKNPGTPLVPHTS